MAADFDLSIRQFVDAWRVLCDSAPGRAFHSEAGIEFVFAGVPIPFFNVAVLTGHDLTAGQLQACAERARSWGDRQSLPWMLIATREALIPGTEANAALDACAYAPAMPLFGMFAQSVAPGQQIPDGLILRVADDDATCSTIIDVNSQAYVMPLDAAKEVWGRAVFWKDHVNVLGSVNGTPVSSSAVLRVSSHRYVALVATTPGQQRRGYADAAMRHALEVSRHRYGNLPSFLHATEAGRPVYERMGYETVAHHVAYIDKKFLGRALSPTQVRAYVELTATLGRHKDAGIGIPRAAASTEKSKR